MAKTPLTYIVHTNKIILPSAQDPPANYGTIQEEMVARMPHTHIAFQEDNIKVWEIIQASLHETEAFNWIKQSERHRNGCAAYLVLMTHYLGTSKNESLQSQADLYLI
jgi:hypothetical protein